MSEAWNLAELRAHICGLEREDDPPLLQVVNSIDRLIQIFSYHLYSARDALKGIIDEAEPTGKRNLELIFGLSDQQEAFAYAKLAHEANVIGSIHAARYVRYLLASGERIGSCISSSGSQVRHQQGREATAAIRAQRSFERIAFV